MDLERYNRNILIEKIGVDGQLKLLNSKVLIAGSGGLGSTVIATLASIGIGTLGLVDNDVLELSNLNRQFIHKFENIGKDKVQSAKEWITSYNPDIEVNLHKTRLNKDNAKEIVQHYDLVIDCFDSYESKFLLNEVCVRNKKPLIHGGVTEFFGQVTIIIPDKSACLNCLFPNSQTAYVIKGVISPAVSTIASIEAMEAVKYLLGFDGLLINQLLTYNGLKQEYKKIKLAKNNTCPVCAGILAE